MRTTVTFDDDVASKLKPMILMSHGKTKEVINDLLRRALGIKRVQEVELPVFNLGLKPGIDPTSLNKLSEELAFDEDLERLQK